MGSAPAVEVGRLLLARHPTAIVVEVGKEPEIAPTLLLELPAQAVDLVGAVGPTPPIGLGASHTIAPTPLRLSRPPGYCRIRFPRRRGSRCRGEPRSSWRMILSPVSLSRSSGPLQQEHQPRHPQLDLVPVP